MSPILGSHLSPSFSNRSMWRKPLVRLVYLSVAIMATVSSAAADPEAVPEGLSAGDWTQIRQSIEADRYRARSVDETPIDGVDAVIYANSSEQQLHSYFSADGVNVLPHDGDTDWRLGMRLARWGFDGNLTPAAAAEPTADGNRVEYRRGALTEWFINDRRGLEQGFTISEPPTRVETTEFQIELAITGGLRATLTPEKDAVVLTDERGGPVLRYAGLHAWDAEHRDLAAALAVTDETVTITVDTADACYPITVDPVFTHETLLLPASPTAENDAHFAYAVAIDGDTVVIGAPDEDANSNIDSGSVYVYSRMSSSWTQTAVFNGGAALDRFGASVAISGDWIIVGAPQDGAGNGYAYLYSWVDPNWILWGMFAASDGAMDDRFGFSVAIDGLTAVVGAPYDDDATTTNSGSAYVYVWDGSSWLQQAKLVTGDPDTDDRFGYSVAVDGDTLLAGAVADNNVGSSAGAAYVFTRSGTTWSQQAKLVASDAAATDYAGRSVALQGDTAIMGAHSDDHAGGVGAGSAYVFVRSGTTWTEQQKLTASDAAADDNFGYSLALDGDTAVIGARLDDNAAGVRAGSAYVFLRSGAVWTEQAKIEGSTLAAGDRMGISVAVDGDTAIVGADMDDRDGATNAGSAWAFSRAGSIWSEQTRLVPLSTDEQGAYFGYSVAISDDSVVVGAPSESSPRLGSAYVFFRSGAVWSLQAVLHSSDGGSGDSFGASVAIDGGTIVVGAPLHGIGDSGAAYVFVRAGATWSEQQKLVASDGAAGDFFGFSVALDSDTAVVGSILDDHNAGSDAGSAYVFTRSGGVWSEQQKLTASDGAGSDLFGAVAVSGDTVVVGARRDGLGANPNVGSAYVFVRTGGVWSEQQKLVAGDAAAEDWFGISVAVDADTVLVGAHNDDHAGGTDAGSAYVFIRSGSVWSEQQKLTASDGAGGDLFGFSVAVAGDLALVGAPGPGLTGTGSAYLFVLSDTIWVQESIIVGANSDVGDNFGGSVALQPGLLMVGAPGDGDLGLGSGSATLFEWVEADLAVTKDDGQTTVIPGQPITYTVTASNAVGPDDIVSATVTDTFPPELVGCTWGCTPASGATCTASGAGDISDSVDLPVGGSVTYSISCGVAPAATGTLTNTAAVDDSQAWDRNPANNTATDVDTLTPLADLSVTKDDGQTTAAPGGQVIYTITAANAGPSDAAGSVVVDAFPSDLTCTWSCAPTGGATCSPAGGGPINDVVNLPAGGMAVYTATCDIDAGALGTLSNTATVVAPGGVTDPTPGNNSATDVDTLIPEADVSVTKTNGRTEIVESRDTIYFITAANAGPGDALTTNVADTFPPELTTCAWTCSPTGGATCAPSGSGDINDIANLPAGGAAIYTATCTVAASSGMCSNTATVTPPGGLTDPVPGNNSATDVDPITAFADWIFDDGFESNDTTMWSNAVPELVLRVVGLDRPHDEVRTSFRIDLPGQPPAATGPLFAGLDANSEPVFVVTIRHQNGVAEMSARTRLDNGSWTATEWQPVEVSGRQLVVAWQRSLSDLADGHLFVHVDGAPVIGLVGLVNSAAPLEAIAIGETRDRRSVVEGLVVE